MTVMYTCNCYAVISRSKSRLEVPRIGEDAFCMKHNRTVQVVLTENSWAITCLDCRYGDYWGAARMSAHVHASRHAIRRYHRVAVYCGSELVHVSGQDREQPSLFDQPPF